MNAKMSVPVICVEAITYLLLYNSHEITFQGIAVNINLAYTRKN